MTKKSCPLCWHNPASYQVKVIGQLGNEWSEWFDCMTVESNGSFTTITANLLDQSALHGLLVRVRDLGLPLISVNRIDPEPTQEKLFEGNLSGQGGTIMANLTIKEKVFYGLICNEDRVYKHWYTRFMLAGLDLERIRRVVRRIRKWRHWCAEWFEEGCRLEEMARTAAAQGQTECAIRWFHESAGCFQVGQHFFFLDDQLKRRSLEKIWEIFPKALALYPDSQRPIRMDIPFRGVHIPGYLRLHADAGRPLVIQINGLDNIKECEQHTIGQMLFHAGFNAVAFDGPGQGEMWPSMKMIPDYDQAVSAVIDWIGENHGSHIDMDRVGVIGFSMGGFLGPLAAAHDKRIQCVAANGGPADLDFLLPERRVNPILLRGMPHVAGTNNLSEAVEKLGYDITKAPPLDRPMLIHHAGNDKLIPHGRRHANKFMNWAVGEKELKFYPDGEHVCANYLDEVLPYAIDWLKMKLGC